MEQISPARSEVHTKHLSAILGIYLTGLLIGGLYVGMVARCFAVFLIAIVAAVLSLLQVQACRVLQI